MTKETVYLKKVDLDCNLNSEAVCLLNSPLLQRSDDFSDYGNLKSPLITLQCTVPTLDDHGEEEIGKHRGGKRKEV